MEAFPAFVVCLLNRVRAEREYSQVFKLVVSDGESREQDEGVLHFAVFNDLSVYCDHDVVQFEKHRKMVALAVQSLVAERILDNIVIGVIILVSRVSGVSLAEVDTEIFGIVSGSHAVDDIVIFGFQENGIDILDCASVFLNPETDAEAGAVTVDVVVEAVIGDEQVLFCLGVSLGDLHRGEA